LESGDSRFNHGAVEEAEEILARLRQVSRRGYSILAVCQALLE